MHKEINNSDSIMKKFSNVIHGLYMEQKWETSKFAKFIRTILFKIGFSQCRYCIYFKPENGDHKTIREAAILTKGKCEWSNIAGVDIDKKRASRFYRCDAFTPVLYNIKGYAITDAEVKNILLRRWNYFFSWIGLVISIVAASIAYVHMIEARKERIRAEQAYESAKNAQNKAEVANKKSEEIGEFLIKLVMVDHAIGYKLDSFAVREQVSPLLRKKAIELMERLNIKVNNDLPDTVEEWLSLPDGSEERNQKWEEIQNIISELLESN
ncbi:MAG: hypothetical protein ABIH08_06225 [Candidatus Omnitrophota bacterium]